MAPHRSRTPVVLTIVILWVGAVVSLAIQLYRTPTEVVTLGATASTQREDYQNYKDAHEFLCSSSAVGSDGYEGSNLERTCSAGLLTLAEFCADPDEAHAGGARCDSETVVRSENQYGWGKFWTGVGLATLLATVMIGLTLVWTRSRGPGRMDSSATTAPIAPNASGTTSLHAALLELQQLHHAGLITDDEFASRRQTVLDRI